MNVKCPYCNCVYNIDMSLLRNPSGDEHLGYGWWLRCYKCHKKWWLRNTDVERTFNTPLTADRQSRIDRLSALTNRPTRAKRPKARGYVTAKIAVFMLIATCAYALYLNRHVFYDYILAKARRVSESATPKISVTDVKYEVADAKMVVTGTVVNDDAVVARVGGIRVTVFEGSSEVLSWSSKLEPGVLLPGQRTEFSTEHDVRDGIEGMRVEVSIF
jgi:ferric-dicitrate binding protein FerR (iron transport regulator)